MLIGHASIGETGAKNQQAGDQTGKEVCTRSWYSKPWNYVLRCKNSEMAEKMAIACEQACSNNRIGYDQNNRNTLRTQAKLVGYDLSKIKEDCECDCSSFMAVCAECAGIEIPYNSGNAPTTTTMKKAFTSTGLFDAITDLNYTMSCKYLKRGDILVRAGSHTVMALENGELSGVPTMSYFQGIDVSSCQKKINWGKVKKSGISFAVLRSTLKSGQPDPSFETNLQGCMENSIDYSCYKYCYAETEEEANTEAKGVIKLIGTRKMRIWLDLEDAIQLEHIGKAGITKVAKAFIKTCETLGYDVGIYCNLNWYKNYIDDSLKKYPLWIARYGKNDGKVNEVYRPNVGESVWQYSSVGKVDGISTSVDLNVMGVK